MKLFLTSNIGGIEKINGEKIPVKFFENNSFLDNLKLNIKDYNKFILIASNPDNYEQNDRFLKMDIQALELSGLKFNEYLVLDNRNKDTISEVLKNNSLIFLCGGNTYQQNLFFNKINLKKYLKEIDSCIVGISAGAINSAEIVFNSPEKEDDLINPYILNGLALTDINVEPHYDEDNTNEIQMKSILKESNNRIIYGIPDGSYILNKTIFGKCYKIKNGEITLISNDNEKNEIE